MTDVDDDDTEEARRLRAAIGANLVRLRGARRAYEVEQGAGLGKGSLSRYEAGERRPKRSTTRRLAAFFGVQPERIDPGFADGSAPARTVEQVDQFPSRAQAIALLEGLYPEPVLRSLRLEAYSDGVDPGIDHWLARAKDLRDKRTAAAGPVVETKAPDMSKLIEPSSRRGPGRRR